VVGSRQRTSELHCSGRSVEPDEHLREWCYLERVTFIQRIADNLADVIRMLTQASSTDEALIPIAALLGVEEAEVMVRLSRFDMLALTRAAYERRLEILDEAGLMRATHSSRSACTRRRRLPLTA
jgi:hypothetical protein